MKKLLILTPALALVCSLAACGDKTEPTPSDDGTTAADTTTA